MNYDHFFCPSNVWLLRSESSFLNASVWRYNEPFTYSHCENLCCSQSHVPGKSTYFQWWVLRERCGGGAAALAVGAASPSPGHHRGAALRQGSGGGVLPRRPADVQIKTFHIACHAQFPCKGWSVDVKVRLTTCAHSIGIYSLFLLLGTYLDGFVGYELKRSQ